MAYNTDVHEIYFYIHTSFALALRKSARYEITIENKSIADFFEIFPGQERRWQRV